MPEDSLVKNQQNTTTTHQLRYAQMTDWLQNLFSQPITQLTPMTADASHRRYFRISTRDNVLNGSRSEQISYVVMDAPPDQCDCQAFIQVAQLFKQNNINVPTIYAQDSTQGFLLLSDFGDDVYLNIIDAHNATHLYEKAFNQLVNIQAIAHTEDGILPTFSAKQAHAELTWFNEWYLQAYLDRDLTSQQVALLNSTFDLIIEHAFDQPTACIHYDFHSRNLIQQPNGHIGILDFQDAARGPIAYDIMSLMYDHYIAWTHEQQRGWIYLYQQKLITKKLIPKCTLDEFQSWVDWLAMQRILRNMGNFARLSIRDNKPGYLKDLPLIYNYVLAICQRYPQLQTFSQMFSTWAPTT